MCISYIHFDNTALGRLEMFILPIIETWKLFSSNGLVTSRFATAAVYKVNLLFSSNRVGKFTDGARFCVEYYVKKILSTFHKPVGRWVLGRLLSAILYLLLLLDYIMKVYSAVN